MTATSFESRSQHPCLVARRTPEGRHEWITADPRPERRSNRVIYAVLAVVGTLCGAVSVLWPLAALAMCGAVFSAISLRGYRDWPTNLLSVAGVTVSVLSLCLATIR